MLSEPVQTFRMKLSAKTVNGYRLLATWQRRSISNVSMVPNTLTKQR